MYEWESSQDGLLPLTSEPSTGGTIEGNALLSKGQHAITLRDVDSSGKTKTESLAMTVDASNTEPSCSISEPISGTSFVEGQSIGFVAMVDEADMNNSLLSVQWYGKLWERFLVRSWFFIQGWKPPFSVWCPDGRRSCDHQ